MTKKSDSSENILKNLKNDWEQIEKFSIDNLPSTHSLTERLLQHQQQKKKAFYKEVALFMFVAILFLSCLSVIAFQFIYILVILEIISILLVPILYIVLTRKLERKIFHDRK